MSAALHMTSLVRLCGALLLAIVPGTLSVRDQAQPVDPLADFLANAGSPPGNTNDPMVNDRNPDSPFGNPLVNDVQNVPTPEAKKKVVDMENTLLLGEITEHIAEEREEEKIEEVCVNNDQREQTTYEAEQMAVVGVFKNVSADFPLMDNGVTAAHMSHHECGTVWKTHRGLYKGMFRKYGTKYSSDGTKVRLPNFPARIGELVIEEVRHREPVGGQHVVLQFKGCSSCENDLTEAVEYGGLTPVDELGAYLKDGAKDQIVQVRKSYSCLDSGGCSRSSDYNSWTSPSTYGPKGQRSKKVSRAFYMFSSYQGDARVEPLLNMVTNPGFDSERKAQALDLLTNELHAEAKHIPFNHKLEQLRIKLFVCSEADAGSGKKKLECGQSEEELVVHDGAIMSGSTTKTLLEKLGEYENCNVGPCKRGTRMTTCTTPCETPSSFGKGQRNSDLCYAGKVALSDANPPQWQDGMFSCIEEITINDGLKADTPIVHRLGASGLFFRTGTESKAHVTGAINWHVTVPRKNQCMPELGDALYVGLGVDEADACAPKGPDLDLGIIMYKCKADGLDGLHNCPIVDAITFKGGGSSGWWSADGKNGASRRSDVPKWGMYSGDNLSGEGEGDDEWFFLRLDAMKALGVTHVAISAFVYGCEGNSRKKVEFSQLEGAFMRFVSGPPDQDQFPASETIAYYDLDVGMAKASGKGALMAVAFLEKESDHPVQMPEIEKLTRKDTASKSGEHWQLAFLAETISAHSLFNGYEEISNKLFKVEDLKEVRKEAKADELTKMGTGMKDQVSLSPMFDGLAQNEIAKIESTGGPGETRDEKGARLMSAAQFWRDFTVTVPGGHPGRALFCAA